MSACGSKTNSGTTDPVKDTSSAPVVTTETPSTTAAVSEATTEPVKDYSSWPEKDVHILIPSAPGGSADTLCRKLAEVCEKKNLLNGHSIVIENIKDSSGAQPYGKTQAAEPDGYTLTLFATSVVTSELFGVSPVKYHDFTYLMGFFTDPQHAYARADAPYNNLIELAEYAKANPGKVNWGVVNPTGTSTLLTALYANRADIDINTIIYDGGGAQLTAALGGFVDGGITEYTDVKAQIESGELKLLGCFSNERVEGLDVLTAKEQGFDIVCERARGFAGPKGMDPALCDRINSILTQVWESEEYQEYMDSVYADKRLMSPEEFLASYESFASFVTEAKGILGL